ncbi:hypothetical protein DV515_00010536 [Chloebia gouldiae]|uniref:Uncharacterized protein n=1 Tax=Chloebia gouldiae TaxID=44316 RepID=A0A3L8S8S1_CHLGU|nr:hypothetical protein DV515_00010536 [Chloebia gouldiae]
MARRALRGLLLLEAAGLLGALLLYRAMERSQGLGRVQHWLDRSVSLPKRACPATCRVRAAKRQLLPWLGGQESTDFSSGVVFIPSTSSIRHNFRHTMQKRFPSILEVYYKSNERSGIHGIRENDQMTWLSSKN